MKILSGSIIPLLGSVTLLASGSAEAQEYFRDFGTSRSSGGVTPGSLGFPPILGIPRRPPSPTPTPIPASPK